HWNPQAVPGQEVFMCVLPFFHLYGQQIGLNQAVYLGSSLVLFPRYDRKAVLQAIDKYHPTIFPGVTTLYINLMEDPHLGEHNLRSIKVCLSGAMALPQEVQEKFEAIGGGRMVEGYGMTETGPVTHSNTIGGKRKIGSIGLPLSDTDAKIVNIEDGETEMAQGQPGEICVRGPQVMQGYWNKPDETVETIRNGWLHTGDIGKMDEDGFFYVVDR